MSRRMILILSGAITAFALVSAGAVVARTPAPRAAAAAGAGTTAPPETVPRAVVEQREASYRRLLDDANARIRRQRAEDGERRPRSPHPNDEEREHGTDEDDES